MSYIDNLISFLDHSPSAFHSTNNLKEMLKENGYKELQETSTSSLKLGGKYFVTRNDTSIIAFNIGSELDLNDVSYNIVASHTDSPTFKVKPNCDLVNQNYLRLSVEAYGGMLCAPWLDRPLSIAGRIILKTPTGIETKLVNIDRDLLIIPNVAIHFNRQANSGFAYNLSVDTIPLVSLNTKTTFLDLLAKELKINKEDIIAHDLYLYNRVKGSILGFENELFSSSKIDNLECAYCSTQAFIEENPKHHINVVASFDNEEVGSLTRQGAASTFLKDTLEMISYSLGLTSLKHKEAIAKSFLVSSDNAHAIHPNHPELSDALNNPKMNQGIVIKFNAAQSYTTDGLSCAIFKEICSRANVPYQFFTNRADLRGGGTLGNISTSQVPLMSVDIGLAQLAMHSSYETAGTLDVTHMINALKEFYKTTLKTSSGTTIDLISND